MLRRELIAAMISAATLGAVACAPQPPLPTTASPAGASGMGANPPVPVRTVDILVFGFGPETLEIVAGTTVRWTNDDAIEHSVTEGRPGVGTPRFDSGLFTAGQTYEYTFAVPGTYSYYCLRHPFMRGTVVVRAV